MAKQSLFVSQEHIDNNIDLVVGSIKNPDIIVNKIINKHSILVIPEQIYKHLAKYNGLSLNNIQDYLSYEDIALFIGLNEIFNFDSMAIVELSNKLSSSHRINVDFIMKTKNYKLSLNEFMTVSSGEIELYNFVNIDNFIYVVVQPGVYSLLQNKKHKVEFLTKFSTLCFNVLGDSNTYAQPFFQELVQGL